MRAALPLLALAAALAALPAAAKPPEFESNLLVYGNDACPKSEDPDEIVVCARRPEAERYRIPPRLRELPEDKAEVAWGTRVATLDEASRATRPNSCSPVGAGGQTGCTEALLRQWMMERGEQRAGGYIPAD